MSIVVVAMVRVALVVMLRVVTVVVVAVMAATVSVVVVVIFNPLHIILRFCSTQIYSETFFLNIFFLILQKTMKFVGYIKCPMTCDSPSFISFGGI